MTCQYCNHNEADHTFRVLMMGEEHEVHLCSECTNKFREYYEEMQRAGARGPVPFPGRPNGPGRRVGEDTFPADAGREVKLKRELNSLRNRLQEAVATERYEEAARLRDEIALHEKEVFAL